MLQTNWGRRSVVELGNEGVKMRRSSEPDAKGTTWPVRLLRASSGYCTIHYPGRRMFEYWERFMPVGI